MSIRKHELVFRPRARLVSILGEHLISDQAVGLIELVKNSYDADATEVSVEILGLDQPDDTTVIVHDNGRGMTLQEVQEKWLSPAVADKEHDKVRGHRTPLGRLPIGEKGVGRFAVHQIGRKLEMITRARQGPEVRLSIDWDRFDDGLQYLDNMAVEVVERDPLIFTEDRTGTRLIIRAARAPWSSRLIEKVHRTLRRLQSPLPDEDVRFRVRLNCPQHPEYENIDPTDILERAHYTFRALVGKDGQCDFEYDCKHPGVANRAESGTENLVPLAAADLLGGTPRCGPFWLNLYVWDRSREHLLTSGVSARELDAQSGVSLFRDGLRVLPYGEPGDDWLFLDQERIQAPAERIGNNQVIGLVLVDQSTNLLLRDKTSREGLIENQAFLDLRSLVRAAIRLFTTYWKRDRPPREDATGRERRSTIADAKRVAEALRETARADVEVRIPDQTSPNGPESGGDGVVKGVDPGVRIVSQPEALELLLESLGDAEGSIEERERRLDLLLYLAATGLAAERVVHEFGRQVTSAGKAVTALRPHLPDTKPAKNALMLLETCLNTLRNEFRVLAPYEAVERSQRARDSSVRDAADLVFGLNRSAIMAARIVTSIEGEDLSLKVRPASLVQVLDNLVHNACYWLVSAAEENNRRLGVIVAANQRKVLVVDSGPGLQGEAADHAFEAFFTMKTDGKGLGLHISAELMRSMHGNLRLADSQDQDLVPAWATGAAFVLDFSVDNH